MSQISQIKKIYHAAIYVRLSKEDGAVASHEKTESNSIANQKSLIRDFLENKNDIEVVQEAGIGVAMGNACDEALNAADYVTASVDDDGIAKALAHLGVI